MKEYILKSDDFLVSQTDSKGFILFANDDFCKVAGFTLEELVGKPHNIVRHKDMPKAPFKSLWETIKEGKIWDGYIKNMTKEGGFYWVYATVYPLYDETRKEQTYLSCRRKPSEQEILEAEMLYKTMK
ncbi:MAG: PAS domain-containing protein [Sulfurimonas sp.]|jgi:PAS domain S-box-containing protein|uniref:PAS domain-containing protein n=1 Tax=Sulfurimonas sp. TaxID=2022749 RepID=UPI00262FACBB|nr:PAS domain-containing protein [Sulfurimonas sp.]MDD3477126.1 PAS domain-containing protein [Sulfurimonas sp.]HUH42040.1 PAS domain-containing protein [Sulfurimonas sp.]